MNIFSESQLISLLSTKNEIATQTDNLSDEESKKDDLFCDYIPDHSRSAIADCSSFDLFDVSYKLKTSPFAMTSCSKNYSQNFHQFLTFATHGICNLVCRFSFLWL